MRAAHQLDFFFLLSAGPSLQTLFWLDVKIDLLRLPPWHQPWMIFHWFDMQNRTQKRQHMICSTGMDPVTCKGSPWESKDWKRQCFPSCFLLSSLTTSLILLTFTISKLMSHCRRAKAQLFYLYIRLMLVSSWFLPLKRSLCSFRHKVFRFSTYSQKSLMQVGSEPWSCFKISTSGVKRSCSVICYLL